MSLSSMILSALMSNIPLYLRNTHFIDVFLSIYCSSQMLIIRYFLEYLSEGDITISTGVIYAIIIGIILLLRGLSGAFFWMLNYEAGEFSEWVLKFPKALVPSFGYMPYGNDFSLASLNFIFVHHFVP